MIEHSAMIETARSWVRVVPFKHQGRSLTQGVDCAGAVIVLGKTFGLLPEDYDLNGYRRVPDGTMFEECKRRLTPAASLEEAHVALLRFSEEPQHLAVIAPYKYGGWSMIHALESAGGVVEHRIDRLWKSRIIALFRWPGVN